MSTEQRPPMLSLPVRVELAPDAGIVFEETQVEAIRFSQLQIDQAFRSGLLQPARTEEREPDVPASATLTGDAQFFVGEVDLGREVGMEVLMRGFEAAIDASLREHRERHPRLETDDDVFESGPGEGAFDEPDLLGRSREVTVSVEEVGDRFDDLLDEVDRGAHVAIVRDGKRVEVMVSWSAFADLRWKLASRDAAYWSAWRSGVFDTAGYAADVTRSLHRHPEVTASAAADGGDYDDETD